MIDQVTFSTTLEKVHSYSKVFVSLATTATILIGAAVFLLTSPLLVALLLAISSVVVAVYLSRHAIPMRFAYGFYITALGLAAGSFVLSVVTLSANFSRQHSETEIKLASAISTLSSNHPASLDVGKVREEATATLWMTMYLWSTTILLFLSGLVWLQNASYEILDLMTLVTMLFGNDIALARTAGCIRVVRVDTKVVGSLEEYAPPSTTPNTQDSNPSTTSPGRTASQQ